jgi:hypothetical protein
MLTLVLLAIITLGVVPFRAYAPFPTLLPFFKCVLEVIQPREYKLRSYLIEK